MLEDILGRSLLPHGSCLLWQKDLLFLYITGDSLTFVSYFLIPIGLVYLVRKRDDLRFDWIFLMFAAFIFFCGITHMMGLINIWHGYYYIEGAAKLATGVISTTTAVMLWKLIPKALAIPSQHTLEARNHELVRIHAELAEANRTLEARVAERTRELERLAVTDSLTGLYNRGEILRCAAAELDRSVRYSHVFSVMMIDVDLFKAINDQFGHQTGDMVLQEVAGAIQATCRMSDSAGRYGGEEFLLICPETGKQDACQLAERIRTQVGQLNAGTTQVTCSIGVGTYQPDQDLDALIASADRALYAAKDAGRNRVVCGP